jgi:hypothetical protein
MPEHKLSLRFRILRLINKSGEPLSADDIHQTLAPEYGGERQVTPKNLEGHLLPMKAVGLVSGTTPYFDEAGEVHENYEITDFGRNRISCLPSAWR